jgi:hypothetical protein
MLYLIDKEFFMSERMPRDNNDPSYWEALLKDEGLDVLGVSNEAAGDALEVGSPDEATERDEIIRQQEIGEDYLGN